jgi:hypothetical protein
MSTISEKTGLCLQVEDNLVGVLDGSADAALFEHIADCDLCRDLRHDAERAATAVKQASADFRAPAGFSESLLAKIEAARPNGPTGPSSLSTMGAPVGQAAVRPQTPVAAAGSVKAEPRSQTAAPAAAPAKAEVQPTPVRRSEMALDTIIDPVRSFAPNVESTIDPDIATAPTALAPLAALKTNPSPRSNESSEAPAQSGRRTAEPPEQQRSSGVAAAVSGLDTARSAPKPGRGTEPGAPEPSALKSGHAVSARPAEPLPAKTGDVKKGGKVLPFFRRPVFLGSAVLAMAAAAAAGFYVKGRSNNGPQETVNADAPWSGKVALVSRASADKTGGFEACDSEGKSCTAMTAGTDLSQGTTLRTDARTRARVKLSDGTWMAMDRDTEIAIAAGKERAAKVVRGSVVADVANLKDAAPARFAFDTGSVEVLGTKLQITAARDRASVEVARGTVRVKSTTGKWLEVRAGEEATIGDKGEPVVASSASLADVMEWSDQSQEEVDAPVLRGLGELRAKKPGDTKEKDRAVHLAKHAVKVRIVDLVARTEVDETFNNDTDEELEGIYRFPLPPDAQIENLALEVDGQLISGAFVDRDKGAAIWRGAIQNAAPKQVKQREEIIWVPGPWHDPALLEWQRGGRFELRIFPIPKRGSRRVKLTYTQTVDQSAGVRRFTYPLAHDTSGTTKIDSFDMDVQLLGHSKEFGVTARGYELASASGEGEADRRTFHADGFTPAGDLTVEYALPDRDKEVTAWAYRMDSAPAPATSSPTTPGGAAAAQPAVKAGTSDEKAAIEAARQIANDTSPYVAIALRPKLPRWQEQKERTHVIVVDTSRSMVGERFARARRLASTIVKEMDRRDSFVVLACDTTCRGMDGSIAPRPMTPGAGAAGEVEKFLDPIEPDGGSDLAAAISAARAAAGSSRGKELRILYLGDGTPTVGPTRASHLEAAVHSAMPPGDGAIVAVALGTDSDTKSLQALARGGGGVVVPYVPGQKVTTAALEVLSAAYGVVLRDPEIELPPGLTQVTPSRLDPIRAGGETIIVARMAVDGDVTGTIKLRGRVAGERFEQTYPVRVVPTSSAGNAFVPRLFAAAKIADLERTGGDLAKPMIVELSKRFAVASEFTSLLVLESAAMFKAFGLDRGSVGPAFTGEVGARSESADAENDPSDTLAEDEAGGGLGSPGGDKDSKSKAEAKGGAAAEAAADDGFGSGHGRSGASVAAASAAPAQAAPPSPVATMGPPPATKPSPAKKVASCAPGDPFCFDDLQQPRREPPRLPPQRPLVAMKRVFERRAGFEAANTVAQDNLTKVAAAETALQAQPDSRDKTAALYALYATAGRLGEAQELTSRWSGRDALDPDALLARVDLAVRQGDRERAIRILGGLTDVRPGDKAIQTRLIDLFDAAQNPTRACAHRIALADIATTDAKAVAAAVSCARAQGMAELADTMRRDVDDKTRDAVDKTITAAAVATPVTSVRGDVQVTADWNGAADIDVALIDAQGKRMSWLGSTNSKVTVSALNTTSTRTESVGFVGLGSGSYVIEITRAAGNDANVNVNDVIRGDLTLRLPNGGSRKVPFTLNGPRAEAGTLRVFFESKLVPVDGGFGGFGGWGRR